MELSRLAVAAALTASACRPAFDDWERRALAFRDLRDRAEIAEARGEDTSALRRQLDAEREELKAKAPRPASDEDRRAFDVLRETLAVPRPAERSAFSTTRLTFDGAAIGRVGILSRLATEPDREARRRLFLALKPLGTSMPLPRTPWPAGHAPVERAAEALGVPAAEVEPKLVELLTWWRDDMAVAGEPWDFWYANAETARTFPLIADRLLPITRSSYAELGANPEALGVTFDRSRSGTFTAFESRTPPRARVFLGPEAGWTGLLDLLHETGHAVHASAIRTRPAFVDWPDDPAVTEALADALALAAWDRRWQQRHLGAAASHVANLRGRFAPLVLDACWTLFELRVHRDPGADPNSVWTGLTGEYLKITPYAEWPWWAIRAQLFERPGALGEDALSRLLAEEVRPHTRERDYAWLSERLYRWGRERNARRVIEDLLGGPPLRGRWLPGLDSNQQPSG